MCLGGLWPEGPFPSLPISVLPACPGPVPGSFPGYLAAPSTSCASCTLLCPRLALPLDVQARDLLTPVPPAACCTQQGALWSTELSCGWCPAFSGASLGIAGERRNPEV